MIGNSRHGIKETEQKRFSIETTGRKYL